MTTSAIRAPTVDDYLGKPRQLRMQITGGRGDVEALIEEIKAAMADRLQDSDWELTLEDVQRLGDVGPLHKGNLGFITKP